MDSIERKKTKPNNINEKEILDIVAAKGSYLSSISENLEGVPPHKESSSRAESKKTITDEEVKKYIEALLNNFSSNRRKPLHIDAQVYECISDIVWAVRRKDFTVSGVISRILVEHIKENAGMIKKITGRDYKLLQP